jgi:UDP-N-acetyl-D-glucosamine dehydrogenase
MSSTQLVEKLNNRTATCAVIGLGYVGLPLVVELAKAGFTVYGIDVSEKKVDALKKGTSYIIDVPSREVKELVEAQKFFPTTDFSVLKQCDTANICVPTPLRKTKEPDISYVVAASKEIQKYLHKGQMIILESTTYPGTTDEVLLALFEETGLKVGEDFFLAFSPERVDPSNPVYQTRNIPKVVGGMTPACNQAAIALYSAAVDTVVPVSSPKTAEMVKLLENTFRSVNIGMVNELCLMSDKLGVDVWEVIDAAATKPFGFMPFYPGPGLGGHCIPIDPFYLSWKARITGFDPRFIELAGEINRQMPEHVVTKIQDALNIEKKALNGAKVLILGVAYKKDVDDVRESPAIEIINLLHKKGAEVSFSDPHVDVLVEGDLEITGSPLTADKLRSADIAVIVTNHTKFDYQMIVDNAAIVLDTRNALKGFNDSKIIKI